MVMGYRLKKKKAKHLLVGEAIDYQPYYEYKTNPDLLEKIREAWEHKKDGCTPGECTSSTSHATSDIRRGRYYERIRNEFLTITQIRDDTRDGYVVMTFEGFGTYTYRAEREWVFKLNHPYQTDLEGLLQPPARSYGDRLSELFPLMA